MNDCYCLPEMHPGMSHDEDMLLRDLRVQVGMLQRVGLAAEARDSMAADLMLGGFGAGMARWYGDFARLLVAQSERLSETFRQRRSTLEHEIARMRHALDVELERWQIESDRLAEARG